MRAAFVVLALTAVASQAESSVSCVSTIASGAFHTCALLFDGNVRCWGWGTDGRLGLGHNRTIGDDELPSTEDTVRLGGRVLSISSGLAHSCAVLEGGLVRCWGAGGNGRLGHANTAHIGDDEFPSSLDPVSIGGTALSVTAGGSHSCVLLEGGNVRCWGSGSSGVLGYGNTNTIGDNELPSSVDPVSLGAVARSVSAGFVHTCALLEGGNVRCWGAGSSGVLGYGNINTIGDNELPSSVGPVSLGAAVLSLSTGTSHSCVLLEGGLVRCWGLGNDGRLGYGNSLPIGDNELPSSVGPVSLGATAILVSAGGSHSCSLLVGGLVRCWGRGTDGRLGYGNTDAIGDNELPSSVDPVSLGAPAVSVNVGGSHTCAILTGGLVRCWGPSSNGELGYGNTVSIGDNEHPSSFAHNSVQVIAVSWNNTHSPTPPSCNGFALRAESMGITSLDEVAGRGGTGASSLFLSGNPISSIDAEALSRFTMLSDLDIRHGNVTRIRNATFTGHRTLASLQLIGNPITSIESGAFSGLEFLSALDLRGMALSHFASGTFDGLAALSSLQLTGNPIHSIDSGAFRGLSSLPSLTLLGMNLTQLVPGTFEGLSRLTSLNLTANPIHVIDSGAFLGLDSLPSLDLRWMNLTQLVAGTFSGLSKVTSLLVGQGVCSCSSRLGSCSGGLLQLCAFNGTLDERVFSGLSSIARADFDRVRVPSLNRVFADMPSLVRVNVFDSALGEIGRFAFSNLPRLEDVHLNRSQTSGIRLGAMTNLPRLRSFIAYGSTIETIHTGAFQGVSSLSTEPEFRFVECAVRAVEPFAFAGVSSSAFSVLLLGNPIEDLDRFSLPPSGTASVIVDQFICKQGRRLGRESGRSGPFPVCEDCPLGFFCPGPEVSGAVFPCPRGTFGAGVRAASVDDCQACPAGTFNQLEGQSSLGCLPCPIGTFSVTAGLNSSALCVPCPSGTYGSAVGSAACSPCPPGTFHEGRRGTSVQDCVPCPFGTWSSLAGLNTSSGCIRCTENRYTRFSGATGPEDCVFDTLSCPSGRVANVTSRTCDACPRGTSTRGAECEQCRAGRFSEADAASECTLCPPGRFSTAVGSSSGDTCTECPPTLFVSSDRSSCESCAPGFAFDEALRLCRRVLSADTLEVRPGFPHPVPAVPSSVVESAVSQASLRGSELLEDVSSRLNRSQTPGRPARRLDGPSDLTGQASSNDNVLENDDWVLPLAFVFGLGVAALLALATPEPLKRRMTRIDVFDMARSVPIGEPVRRIPDFVGSVLSVSAFIGILVAVSLLASQWRSNNIAETKALMVTPSSATANGQDARSVAITGDFRLRLFGSGSSLEEFSFLVKATGFGSDTLRVLEPGLPPARGWSIASFDTVDASEGLRIGVADLVCSQCALADPGDVTLELPWTFQRISAALWSTRSGANGESRHIVHVNSSSGILWSAHATISLLPEVTDDRVLDTVTTGHSVQGHSVSRDERDRFQFLDPSKAPTWTLRLSFIPTTSTLVTTVDYKMPVSQLLASMFALASAIYSAHRLLTRAIRQFQSPPLKLTSSSAASSDPDGKKPPRTSISNPLSRPLFVPKRDGAAPPASPQSSDAGDTPTSLSPTRSRGPVLTTSLS